MCIGAYAYMRHVFAEQRAAAEAALDLVMIWAGGWLTLRRRGPWCDAENAALVVLEAYRRLPPGWPRGRDHEYFHSLPPAEQLDAADFASLRSELHELQPAVDEVRKLKKLPRGRYSIVYQRDFWKTMLDEQTKCCCIIDLLALDALLREQEGDVAGAVQSVLRPPECGAVGWG